MKDVPLVLFHANCWDGFCAAWAARAAIGPIEAVPVYYGQRPPPVRDRAVYVLDFSYPRETLVRMREEASFLIVLDHHKTAFEECKGLSFCHFDETKSGGRLTWEYFSSLYHWGDPPWLVLYTEDRDLWRHKLPESENVNAALRSYPLDFDLWDSFHNDPAIMLRFATEGAAIRRAEKQIVDQHVRNARLGEIEGYTVPIVNATVLFSEIAGTLAKGQSFGACYFDRKDGLRQWSLRSSPEGVDVSQIAKRRGGGGHQHAAGFEEKLK